MILGKISVFAMIAIIVSVIGAFCQNNDDANMTFCAFSSIVIAAMATVLLAERGVV